jgi:hypothetical protein
LTRTGRETDGGDVIGISTELRDVLSNPFVAMLDVLQARITGTAFMEVSRTVAKPSNVETVVDGNEDKVVAERIETFRRVLAFGTASETTPVRPVKRSESSGVAVADRSQERN